MLAGGTLRGRRSIARWTLVLVLLGLAWRAVRYGVGFPIWGDEAFLAISLVGRDYGGLTEPLEYVQIAPLLFLWVERLAITLLGESDRVLRLVPFLAGLASVPLLALLARRALPSRHGALVALAIFAASYYPVRHGAEVKPYATDLLLSLLLLVTAWWTRSDRRGWLVLAPLAPLSVWASYPAAFVAGGAVGVLGTAALLQCDRRRWAAAALTGAILVASFATMYAVIGAPHAEAAAGLDEIGHWDFTFPPISEPWQLPAWFARVHTGNLFAYPNGSNDYGSTLTFLLFLVGAVALWRRDREGLLILVSPFALMFVAAVFRKYPYGGSARVALHVAPAVCLLAGFGLVVVLRSLLSPRRARNGVMIGCAILGAVIIVSAVADVVRPYKKWSDAACERLVRTWSAETSPADLWVIYGRLEPGGDAPDWIPWGGSAARIRLHLRREGPENVRWGPPPDTVPAPAGRVLLIVYNNNDRGLAFDREDLDAYVAVLARRFGDPRLEHHPLGDRDEFLDVYRFGE